MFLRLFMPSVGLCALLSLGCGGHATALVPPAPEPANPGVTVAARETRLGGTATRGDIAESTQAIWTVTLDPLGLTGSSALRQTRAATASGDLYALPVDQFFHAGDFEVLGVTRRFGVVEMLYAVHHPFPAPRDLAAPSNATDNRADLGIAGMTVLLADVPGAVGHRYFDDVVANTTLMTNADGYCRPRGLIDSTAIANTFPYKVLVDERGPAGSRLGVSNGGVPTGNFGTAGWTRGNIGSNRVSWTGYGVLHQGQTALNTFAFDPIVLGAAPLQFDVAVIARWSNPVGGVPASAHRLPPVVPDQTTFGYRMPHGALDGERIEYLGESGGLQTGVASSTALSFRITDWDARATPSIGPLADDPDPTHVRAGEEGPPTLELSLPGVLTATDVWVPATTVRDDDTPFGGDLGVESGHPDDPLLYTNEVHKPIGTALEAGLYHGLIRCVDPENRTIETRWTPLDSALNPITGSAIPLAESFQTFEVAVGFDNEPPTATVDGTREIQSAEHVTLIISDIADQESDPVSVQVAWNGVTFDEVGLLSPPYAPIEVTSPMPYNNDSLTPRQISIPVRLANPDSTHFTQLLPFTFQLGPNRPPQVTGTAYWFDQNAIRQGESFTLRVSLSGSDPEGDAFTRAAFDDRDPDVPRGVDDGTPILRGIGPYSALGPVVLQAYAGDALHQTRDSMTAIGTPQTGYVHEGRLCWWDGFSHVSSMVVTPAGEIYVAIGFAGTFDGDPGTGTEPVTAPEYGQAIVKLHPDLSFEWVRAWGMNSPFAAPLAVTPDGGVAMCAGFMGTVDFDPGPGTAIYTAAGGSDLFCLKLVADGSLGWIAVAGGSGREWGQAIASDPAGRIVLAGYFADTVDFDPGPGTALRTTVPFADKPFVMQFDPAGAFRWVIAPEGDDFSPTQLTDWGLCASPDGTSHLLLDNRSLADWDPTVGTRWLGGVDRSRTVLWQIDPDGAYRNAIGWDMAMRGSCAVLSDGSIGIAGQFSGVADLDPTAGVDSRIVSGKGQFVLRLREDLSYRDAAVLAVGNPEIFDIYGRTVALAPAGTPGGVCLFGTFDGYNRDLDPGSGVATFSDFDTDLFVVQLDSQLQFVCGQNWGGRYGPGQSQYGSLLCGVAQLPNGRIICASHEAESIDLCPGAGIWSLSGDSNEETGYITSFAPDGSW
ncbi:MAG: hypothetical protein ABI743_02005 [bacterium]